MPRQLVENSVSMTDQNQSHPTQGRRRRHKSPASLPSAQHMALPRLVDYLDTADGPSDEEEKKMRSVRDQNLLLLDLPLVDHRANMMRLWESLKWSQGMRKGLKREVIRNSKMLKKLQQEKLTLVVG